MAENNGKKAIKAGIGYSIGNIFVKGIAFISIPIFARMLTVSDYGIYNTYNAYAQIMMILIGLGLHASIKNAKLDYPDAIGNYCTSTLIPSVVVFIVFLFGFLVLGNPIAESLSLDDSLLVPLLAVEGFGMAVITFYESILAVDYKYKEYVAISLAYAIAGIVLSVAFILLIPGKGYLGRAIGATLGAVSVAVYGLVKICRAARPERTKEFCKYGFSISLPVIPHFLSQIVLAQFDRIMIKSAIGSLEAGLYSFAYNIGAIFNAVTAALNTAWTQWFFEQMHQKNFSRIRKVADVYAWIVSAGAIALMLVAPELVTVMGGNKYDASRTVAMPIIMAMFLAFMYFFPSSIEYYYKKTKYIAIGSVLAAILNVVLNAVFIPRFGWISAAYTTVVCYLVYYIMHMLFAKKVHGSNLYNTKCQVLCILTVGIAAVCCAMVIDAPVIRYFLFICELATGIFVLLKNRQFFLSLKEEIK